MPNYPGSLDDDISLFLAVNNARTRLTSSISISDLTIPVVTTSGFPNQGFVTILTNPDDITEAEAIRYVGVTETTFSGTERGAGGTPIFAHAVGNNVDLTVMAEHHNELKDAVIELEKIVGISGSHHFVPKDAQGNAIVSGTLTAQNLLDAGWITTSGSLVVCGPGFFKDDLDVAMDLVVSGTATFGVIPVAVQPAVQLVTNTGIVQITSTSYVDSGCETAPLPAGHNLVFYGASAGGGSIGSGGSFNLKCLFAGTDLGENQDATLNNNNPWGGTNLSGFKMVTGDGVNTAKLQGDMDTSSSSAKVTSQSIMTIPFGDMGLVQNTDYWFANGSDTDTNVTSTVAITTLNVTLPDAGDYIFFGSIEGEHQFDFRAQYYVNGVHKSTTLERSLFSGDQRHFSFAQLQTDLPAGANTFEVRAVRYTTSTARFRRGRICIVRAASFDNVVGFRQNDNQATSSAAYAKVAPTEISYNAAQSETVLVFANPTSFVSTLTGPPAVAYKLVDETAAVDLTGDVSPGRFRETDDKIPALLYSKLDDVFGPKTFSLSIREPEATGSSVEHETVNMLVWSMTLAGISSPEEPVTTIAGNTITTHEINTDIINADSAIISDATVTGILDATLAQTIIGSGTAADFTVSTKLDVTGDLCVSGTAKFGQDDTPPASNSSIIFTSLETEQTTNSTSLVDTGLESAPLLNGVEYLVIYEGSTGNASVSRATILEVQFDGAKIGGGQGEKSGLSAFANDYTNGNPIAGIYKVTGNGTGTIRFQFSTTDAAQTAYVGAMSAMCIPLDDFTQNSDYYYEETTNSDAFTVSNAPQQDPPNTVLISSLLSSVDAGDWLFMWSAEPKSDNSTGRAFGARFQVDGATIGPSRYARYNSNGAGNVFNFTGANVVNIPSSGDVTAEVLVSSLAVTEADFRRGRIFAINTSLFTQVLSTTDSTGFKTASTSFQDFAGLNTTITPTNVDSPIIVLTAATSYFKSTTSSMTSAIRNETDGINYRIDSGGRGSAVGGVGAVGVSLSNSFMSHFEERTSATEYRYQIRSTVTGDAAVGRNDDDTGGELSEMIVWEFTLAGTPFIPITQTCIDDDQINTGTLIADTVTARTELTVSGSAVHAGDPLNLQNLNVAEKLDVTGDLCVSGTAKFGQDNTPAAANGDIIFASQDTEQTTTSATFVDAACETAPLLNGVEYLIIYNGNIGATSETVSAEMQVLFGATRIGRAGFAKSALGTFGNTHYNAGYCHGFWRTTGDGTSTVKFQHQAVGGSTTSHAGAMSITCVPLDSYTQNTDYFWSETTNSDSAVVSNAPIIDPPTTVMHNDTFTSMAAGDWLFLCSAEGNVDAGTTRGAVMRFQVAGATIGASRYSFQGRSAGSLTWNSVATANIVNVAGGNTAIDILVASTGFALADFFRGRVFAIKTSVFSQILNSTDTTGATTTSSAYVDFTPLNTTVVPSQPAAPLIILATAPSYTQENSSGFVASIRNETDAADYRLESGGREAEQGGISDPDINLANSFMSHYETRTASTEYRYQYKSVGTGPVAVGRDDADAGGEHSEMIVWEFLNANPTFVPITQTCIDDDEIQTGTFIADDGQFRTSLTISGVPVSTGTGGGGAVGDFVQRAGDSMTGNLDMAGNNVYNAGVVAMQDDVPVLTTSGLLWFDTDAPGHGDHGSAQLPGGTLAATVTTTTGLGVPDSVFQPNIPWDTEDLDKGGWYDPLFPQRLTVPSGVLYVRVFTNIHFEAENSNNRRQIQIYRNGNTSDVVAQDDQQSILNATYSPSLRAESPVLTVSGGDYFEVAADLNTNGGSLNILADTSSFGIIAADTRGVPGVNTVNLLQGDINVTPGSGIAVNANSQTGEIEISLAQETRDLQVWSPDAPPASGTSFDSEWNPGEGGLTGWTEWDVNAELTVSTLPRAGVLRLKHATSAGGEVSGLIKAAPTSNFTIFTRLSVMENRSRDFKEFGLVLSDDLLGNPSTANFAVVSLPFHEDGTDADAAYFGFATQHFTAYNSFDRNLSFSAVHFPSGDPIYLKVHVDVTTRVVSASASRDGLIWGQSIVSDFSGDLTNITEMGYWINNANSTSPLIITSDFFRVVESVDVTAPMQGGFVTISGVPQAIVVATGTQGGGSGDGNITDINAQEGPSVTVTGAGLIGVITDTNLLTITGSAITEINTQFGPAVTITGAGVIDVITTANVVTISGDGGGSGNLTDINAQTGPSITITGTAGIGVITAGNVITIDGTEVQGAGGGGSTISGCYTHIQSSASDTWNVTHNLSSVPVNYIVLDNSSVEVIPDTFTVNDGDSVTITFAFPQAGTADIFPCVSGTGSPIGETEGTATISGCYSHVQSGGSDTWTVNHGLATEMVTYILLDDTGSQFQPDDFTVVDPNQVTFDFVSNRTGIANIFACTSGTVTFQGGHFSNIVAVTGTFTEGITVGEGTTYITGSGIDTPELKIAGETPNFGAEFSGYYLNPQAKPAVVHSASDWFDDNSGNPTLTGTHTIDTGKWSLWDVDGVAHASNGKTDTMSDGSSPAVTFDTNNMKVIHDGSTIGGWLGYFQAAPSGDFTITGRVSIKRAIFDGSAGGEENTMGVFIADDLGSSPSTADLVAMSLHWDGIPPSSTDWAVYEASEWSDYNSRTASAEVGGRLRENLWVRLMYRVSDGLTISCYSTDGITWSEIDRIASLAFTPASIGFGLNSNKTFTSTGKIDFFAVSSGINTDRPAGHGRLIPLPV